MLTGLKKPRRAKRKKPEPGAGDRVPKRKIIKKY